MRTFEAIVRAYGPGLARVAASYEADRGLREDLLQEILLAIHRALPTLRDEASLGPFVFRIAHNRGITHAMRARDVKRRATLDIPAEPSATPEQQILDNE